MNEVELIVMELIVHAGNSKTHAYNALEMVKEKKYLEAEEEMKKANDEILLAHGIQKSMITQEVNGEPMELSLLTIHAQDHLMTAISEKKLIEQLIELTKTINTML